MSEPAARRAATDLPASFRSAYDGLVHFTQRRDDGVMQAWCTHTVPTAEAVAAGDDDQPRCVPCTLNWGMALAERHGDRDRYAP